MKPSLEQLRRDKILATHLSELDRKHEVLLGSVTTIKSIVEQNKKEVSRILNLPQGARGEKGPIGPRGLQGKDGKDGRDGKDGFTPIKGKDYFTKGDKEELTLGVLARIRTPKDGEDAVVDEEKIAENVISLIKDKQLLDTDSVKGLRGELTSYRNQMAMKQAGQHGGGDTVVAGTGITITSNANGTKTIAATGGGTGTVTDVSVVSANGFAGTVATSTTTPAITLTTSVTGILKGNGTAISAAVAGDVDLILPTQTGQSGKYLTTDGTNSSWATLAGGGNVSNTGTPLNNQLAVWTNATTIEGDADLTFDTTTNTLGVGLVGLDGRVQVHAVKSDASDGLLIEASDGTDVGVLGVANTANVTWYGSHNFSGATQDTIAAFTGAGKTLGSLATATYPSLTELSYVKGVTSSIQTQLNAKAGTLDEAYNGGNTITVDGDAVTLTVPDTSNNVGLIINQNDVTNSPNGLRIVTPNGYSGSHLQIESADASSNPPVIEYYLNTATPTDFDAIGGFNFFGKDDASNKQQYGAFRVEASDVSSGSEDSYMFFQTALAGTLATRLLIGDGINGIKVGANSASGILSSLGNQDLILQTGNATTGTITIVDGADGKISLAPNGSGAVEVTTALVPDANDGAVLGSTTLQWSDLFLAEGAVINWDNGDATLTQTGNVLALAGADLQVATAGVGTNADSVPTLSSTSTFTNKTLTTPVINGATLNGDLQFDATPNTDDTWNGETTNTFNAGATVAQWEAVYLDATPDWNLTDADAVGTAGSVMIALAVEAGTAGNPLRVLTKGYARNDAWTWTIGGLVYLSLTPGALTQTAPSATDDIVRIVGYATSADTIYWNPSPDWVSIV